MTHHPGDGHNLVNFHPNSSQNIAIDLKLCIHLKPKAAYMFYLEWFSVKGQIKGQKNQD